MVSDVLAEAINQIDEYLKQPSIYEGDTRAMVIKVRDHMKYALTYLDTPPGTEREKALENETRK